MAEDDLVSVVIPVRNGERFLGRTLDSALGQTYHPIEVVVVDDGSTDRTTALVKARIAYDQRVRLFRIDKRGVAAARNLAISNARGKLIAPLDADDLWHPQKIARQVEKIRTSPTEVGVVYCWSLNIDENDLVIPPVWPKSTAQGWITQALAKDNLLENSSSPLIRRSCIDAVGGYDPTLQPHGAEDWKLYLALSEICEFSVIPEHLVGYRQSTGSLSRNIAGMVQSTQLVARWVTEKWPDLPEAVERERTNQMNAYFSQLALKNNQFLKALYYRARLWKVAPGRLVDHSEVRFIGRILFRMARLQRIRRLLGRPLARPIPFEEFIQNSSTQPNTRQPNDVQLAKT
jgi:glycosyltransferase involved in cell wall biosynthesis